ncbi:MAG: hypothetical protein ACOC22_04705 [bacterium]
MEIKIRKIINTIEEDITSRKGLKTQWEEIDNFVKEEIRQTWYQQIKDILNECNSSKNTKKRKSRKTKEEYLKDCKEILDTSPNQLAKDIENSK